MLVLLSPAKSLDFETEPLTSQHTEPRHLEHSETLVEKMRTFSHDGLKDLMSISDNLAELNLGRFREFSTPFNLDNSKQAILAFTGDTYKDMGLEDWSEEDFEYAQDHIRILSGLYGTLRPLDLMQPYRLEMGTRLKNERGKNLYEFWEDEITPTLKSDLEHLEEAGEKPVVINCASNEYFKSVNVDELGDIQLINPVFRDWKNGKYKIISFYAKRARGALAAWIVQNRVTDPKDLKAANVLGYEFSDEHTDGKDWVYLRREED